MKSPYPQLIKQACMKTFLDRMAELKNREISGRAVEIPIEVLMDHLFAELGTQTTHLDHMFRHSPTS